MQKARRPTANATNLKSTGCTTIATMRTLDEGVRDGEVKVGMIGAGMVGQLAHFAKFVQVPGCRVTALVELRSNLGRLAAEKFGVPQLLIGICFFTADATVAVPRRSHKKIASPNPAPNKHSAMDQARFKSCETPPLSQPIFIVARRNFRLKVLRNQALIGRGTG